MKTTIEHIPTATLDEFCAKHDLRLRVSERRLPAGHPMRYYASFDSCEVSEHPFLIGAFGNGATPDGAKRDYAEVISMKRIVINAWGMKRREIDVPRLIEPTP